MTLADLVNAVNTAQERTPRGERPSVLVALPTKLNGQRAELTFGTAKLVGKIVAHSQDAAGKWHTGMRFYCDEVMRELQKKGLTRIDQPEVPRIVGVVS
jgi:hypothetical protein